MFHNLFRYDEDAGTLAIALSERSTCALFLPKHREGPAIILRRHELEQLYIDDPKDLAAQARSLQLFLIESGSTAPRLLELLDWFAKEYAQIA